MMSSGSLGLFRMRGFGLLWLAQVASRLGDPITLVALAYVTYGKSASVLLTSLSVVIATLPNAILSVFGGAVADAVGHRRAMVIADIARAVLIGLLPVLLGLDVPLAAVFIVVLVAMSFGTLFNPARVAIVPSLLPSDRLSAGNALVYASDRTVEVVGAFLAGVLVTLIGSNAFYFDALTFLVSAALLSGIEIDEASPAALRLKWLISDVEEGLQFLLKSRILRSNTSISLVAQLSVPVVNALTPALVFQSFSGGDLALGATLFGTAEGALAAGAVGAGIVLPVFLARVPKGRLLLIGWAAYGLELLLLASAPTFTLALPVFVLMGITNVVFFVPNVTISQEHTPSGLRARVFGARIALLSLSWLPAIVLSGALGDVIGVPLLIAFAGLLTLVTAIVGAFIPVVRDVP